MLFETTLIPGVTIIELPKYITPRASRVTDQFLLAAW